LIVRQTSGLFFWIRLSCIYFDGILCAASPIDYAVCASMSLLLVLVVTILLLIESEDKLLHEARYTGYVSRALQTRFQYLQQAIFVILQLISIQRSVVVWPVKSAIPIFLKIGIGYLVEGSLMFRRFPVDNIDARQAGARAIFSSENSDIVVECTTPF